MIIIKIIEYIFFPQHKINGSYFYDNHTNNFYNIN